MLARCPHCGATHAVPRAPGARHGRVRCGSCQAEFDLFPALEIGVAGARVDGPGIRSLDAPEPAAWAESGREPEPRSASVPEPTVSDPPPQQPPPPGPTAPEPPRRKRSASATIEARRIRQELATKGRTPRRPGVPGILLAGLLCLLLAAQLLLFPPLAPGQNPTFDHLRAGLCADLPCPAWHPPRAPEQIRRTSPDLEVRDDGRLRIQLTLESPVMQAWPLLDIALSDRLGHTHGRLRVTPEQYTDDPTAPMLPGARYPLVIDLHSPHPRISGVQVTPR